MSELSHPKLLPSKPEVAQALDSRDELAKVRERFVLDFGVTYLDGNSLGALPASVPGRLRRRRAPGVGRAAHPVLGRERMVDRARADR